MTETVDVVRETDVVVVGGGFAGAWAAIRAAETGARVILTDKARIARSGASTMSSGVTTGPTREDDLEPWVGELVKRGGYLCDERWTRAMLEGQVERLEELDAMGVPFEKDENGRFKRYLSRGMVEVRAVHYNPKRAMELLRERAIAAGVELYERLSITNLLTSDGQHPTAGSVTGVAGIDVRKEKTVVIQARAVVLASGPLGLKGAHGVDNCTGDGMALALEAGAVIADPDFVFGGTFDVVWQHLRVDTFNVGLGHGLTLINRHGERFMRHYDPERMERGELQVVVAAFVKELVEGRGPVYMDYRDCDEAFWESLERVRGNSNKGSLFDPALPDPRTTPVVVEAGRRFWSNGRNGPRIDLEGETSVSGLFAAGAVAKNDAVGTHGSAGTPTAWAMVTGYIAGEHAAIRAASSPGGLEPLGRDVLERVASRILAPLRTPSGSAAIDITTALRSVAELEGTVVENLQLDEESLTKRISATQDFRDALAALKVDDWHDLVKAHECKNIVTWMELMYVSMLDRTESRLQFYRRDYPYTDDFAWRCSHLGRYLAPGRFELSKQEIYSSGKYPPPPPRRYLDPIGEVMLRGLAEDVVLDGAESGQA